MTEPRLIVEVRYGKLAGTKKAVEAGHALKVGRTELADLVVQHDGQMSGTHFELQWDGALCLLRDLGSQGGTRLGGQAATQGEVPHGGWIQAGETDFLVYVEGKTKPPRRKLERSPEDEEARLEAAARACERLRAEAAKAPLYAIVDGARDRRILEVLREGVEPHQSLYDGLQGETLEDVAPYLVGPFRKDSALLDRLLAEGFGNRWGIFCTSYDKFVEVRRHWRRFLMVTLESTNEKVYFRFYDPGVFRVFWPTCSPAQCQEFSAGMEEIFVEEEDLSLSPLVRPL
ncbi:DUF4123 domain-containing protein [Polyangium sp. 6x1]|uniref:DUF4123 domain-containing protein n=1 Tax=Polyangium sp. 6x1 TaxID=3042689 RepID=UPI002482611F|nr:DUF4123 domain-containing protein [Polyangium sp. 6x1]MDI1451236.1 DUF4123 domain-containing protein [Polyangium sp. 6x1]